MTDYGKFTREQREYEMEQEDREWRRLNRRERQWARSQFRAEAICWALTLFVVSLIGFGVYQIMTHVIVPAEVVASE